MPQYYHTAAPTDKFNALVWNMYSDISFHIMVVVVSITSSKESKIDSNSKVITQVQAKLKQDDGIHL